MSILDYFKPVENITVAESREMMKGKKPDEICLLDVRQPKEYEEGHVPGAVLIPIAQLRDRLNELDPKCPTIVYCAIGGRSRAGASILQDEQFDTVYNMKGGFKAWTGPSAEGPPETGMVYFSGTDNPEELLLLAWSLEEGSRLFYEEMAEYASDPDAKKIYIGLAEAEVSHQRTVSNLYYEITGNVPDNVEPFYTKHLSKDELNQLMEGQVKLGEVLAWAKTHTLTEVLEYAIALETKLYDLYSRMKLKYTDPPANKIYASLASEEKNHLDLFIDLLEKKL